MKRNIAGLRAVIRLGQPPGADRFSVCNVLPYTPEMRDQVPYARTIDATDLETPPRSPEIAPTRVEVDELTLRALTSS